MLGEVDSEVKEFPSEEKKDGLNVLGIVVFSILLGVIFGHYREECQPIIDFFKALEFATIKIVQLVIWFSPIGILFLIAGQISGMDDLNQEFKNLALYMVTVLVGLFIHGCITLPLILIFVARRNPLKYIGGMMQALLTALGTASSSATMPLTLTCLEENNQIDERVSRFVIPLGATINMDGTALYEAVAAIYIAQVLHVKLNFGQIVLVSLTATLASIGAAGIPQAGLVTMIMVLIAVGLPAENYTRVIAIDWFLDRIRTMVNVHGDSIGAAVVQRLCRTQLEHADPSFPKSAANGEVIPKADLGEGCRETVPENYQAVINLNKY